MHTQQISNEIFFFFFCCHIICADTICAGITTSSHTQDSVYITSPPQGSTGDLRSLANVLLLFTLWILSLVPVEDVPFILFVFPFFHFVLEDIYLSQFMYCVITCMPGESNCWRLSLLLLWHVWCLSSTKLTLFKRWFQWNSSFDSELTWSKHKKVQTNAYF